MSVLAAGCVISAEKPDTKSQLVKDVYPALSTGMMMEARLSTLPTGVLLQAGSVKITTKDIQSEIAKAPSSIRPQLAKNLFFILENRATRDLLMLEAKAWAKAKKLELPADKLLNSYFASISADVSVSDVELKEFYDKNKDMMGNATFEQVKADLEKYVLDQKRQGFVDTHVASIGKKTTIDVNKSWVANQYTLAMNNPVDKARKSGKPTMVDFGADGCRPCDMMTPVLSSLKTDYAGKVNVLFVHVRKEQILASRYGIQSIPVQVFFDKAGKEVFRHVGFFPKDQIVSKLAEMGVK